VALRRSLTRAPALVLLLLVAACSHGEPFDTAPPLPNPPHTAFGMQRLTFGPEGDWSPVFDPSGLSIAWAWRDPSRTDRDRCLAIMPLADLATTRLICHGGRFSRDSMNSVYAQAFSALGRIAYVQAEGAISRMASARFLVAGLANGAGPFISALELPRLMPDTQIYESALDLHWLDESTIAFLASRIVYTTGVPEASDTAEIGIELARLDVGTGAVTTIPNTRGVEAFSVDPATGAAYVLLADVVYTVDLATGARIPAIDLSAFPRVTGFSVMGGRLVAVVRVGSLHHSGELAVADLPGGTPTILPRPSQPFGPNTGFFFARPRLSPARDRIVAEAFTYTNHVIPPGPARDTVVNHASDLYLITVP
jgi:hypothetical protein